jgi:membrane protease YdiL (CAAX protease family)
VLSLVILIGLVVGKVLRPGVLGERGLRKIDGHPWWVWLLCGVMVFMATILGSAAGQALAMGTGAGAGSERCQAVAGLVGYTVALVVGGVLVRLVRGTAPQAGFAAPPKSFAVGLGWLLVAAPVVYSAGAMAVMIQQHWTGREITDRLAHPTLKLLAENPGSAWTWVIGLVAVVLAPIQEELIFRGFLQTALVRGLGHPWLAILLTSLVFAAAHIGPDMPWYGIAPVFVLGLAMGFAFERTRAIGTSIAMHVGFNAANVAAVMAGGG